MSSIKPHLFAYACFAVFLGVAVWLFAQLKSPTAPASPSAPTAAIAPSIPAASSPKTALPTPVARPPVASAGSVATSLSSAPAAPNSFDPQSDLKTFISEIGRLFLAGNSLEVYENYVAPSEFDPKIIQQIQDEQAKEAAIIKQDPSFAGQIQALRESIAHDWATLADQTPVLNEAGDQATYQLTMNTGGGKTTTSPVAFIKINGKWFFKTPPQE